MLHAVGLQGGVDHAAGVQAGGVQAGVVQSGGVQQAGGRFHERKRDVLVVITINKFFFFKYVIGIIIRLSALSGVSVLRTSNTFLTGTEKVINGKGSSSLE